jgi:hypothetical protein
MARPKRRSGTVVPVFVLGLALALWISAIVGGKVSAQEGDSIELRLTPSRDSGVSGVATLTEVGGGVEVHLRMRDLPEEGVEHINHIHGGGTCAEDRAGRTAPVTIPLTPVVAEGDGTGSATTQLEDLTLARLFEGDEDRFILLHSKAKEGGGVPPGIACADLVTTSDGQTPEDLPVSAGMNVGATLMALGVLFILLGLLASLLPKILLRDR